MGKELLYTEAADVTVADEAYRNLENKIRSKLIELKGTCEDVLPEYILVMVNNNKAPVQVAEDLDAFLGQDVAIDFTNWLWFELGEIAAQERQAAEEAQGERIIVQSAVINEAEMTDAKERKGATGISKRMIMGALDRANKSVREGGDQRRQQNSRRGVKEHESQGTKNRRSNDRNRREARRDRVVREVRGMDPMDDDEGRWKRDRHNESGLGRKQRRGNKPSESLLSRLQDDRSYDENGKPIMNEVVKMVELKVVHKKTRCAFWPKCQNGDSCEYFHPNEMCRNFPCCAFGAECMYIHPSIDCRFGPTCSRFDCQYNHPSRGTVDVAKAMLASTTQSNPCKFSSECRNKSCKFSHPIISCKMGKECKFGQRCHFSHGPACKFGGKCTRPQCSFAHPARFGGTNDSQLVNEGQQENDPTNPSCEGQTHPLAAAAPVEEMATS